MQRIEELEKEVKKYQKYKMCLSKNMNDLQQKYKLVREELALT